jgi:glyoxylase-like metal-dependent hydrolase (beta-lactamase superfamily II)/rhodanese-related sulfurtransferase
MSIDKDETVNSISVDMLRRWLEDGQKVAVVDVRPITERAEWFIPGSIHIDAYEALKAQDPTALSTLDLPSDCPVVAVCIAGKVSQIAAAQLAARGLQVFSLEGGMKAWSLAWNIAEIPLMKSRSVRVIQIRRTGKGCLSYLIGSETQAIVIDASLEPQVYVDVAASYGWHIGAALETHIHADHISRSRQLAEYCQARLYLPQQQRVEYPFIALEDGATVALEAIHLTAIHTSGHTKESTCYRLENDVLFTGDTLFTGGVGRPDLSATNQGETRERAEALYHSLHLLLQLPSEMLVLAGHTSQPIPFDHTPIMTTLAQTYAHVDLLHAACPDFVQTLLERLPAVPPNYDQIVSINEIGLPPDLPPIELEAGANRCAIS